MRIPKGTPKSFSYDDVEAAMCIWEWLFDDNKNETIAKLFETYGTGGMRSATIQISSTVEAAWQITQERELPAGIGEDSFDWEFVPAVCRVLDWDKLVGNNQHGDAMWSPPVEDIIAALIAVKALAA